MKVLHSTGLVAIRRDFFAMGVETAGGATTKLIELTSPLPPDNSTSTIMRTTSHTVHPVFSQIIITNEKGHLSQAEIDRMTQRAEKCCAESESNKAKIEAKNCLRIVLTMPTL